MEYYTTEKNNDILKSAGKCMEIENIILIEVTKNMKNNYHICPHIGGVLNIKQRKPAYKSQSQRT